MRKKTILWLALGGIVLGLIGAAIIVPTAISSASHCSQEQINAGVCSPTASTGARVGIGIGAFLLVVAGILETVAWVFALIRSAQMQTWVWFVVVLLFSGLGTLLYALIGPPDRAAGPAAYPPYRATPGYPPPNMGYPPPNYPPPGSGYPPGNTPTATG